jgi:hypothetical protein
MPPGCTKSAALVSLHLTIRWTWPPALVSLSRPRQSRTRTIEEGGCAIRLEFNRFEERLALRARGDGGLTFR